MTDLLTDPYIDVLRATEARLSEENRVIAILQSKATRNGVVPPIESIAVPPSQIDIEVIV